MPVYQNWQISGIHLDHEDHLDHNDHLNHDDHLIWKEVGSCTQASCARIAVSIALNDEWREWLSPIYRYRDAAENCCSLNWADNWPDPVQFWISFVFSLLLDQIVQRNPWDIVALSFWPFSNGVQKIGSPFYIIQFLFSILRYSMWKISCSHIVT